MSRDWLIILLVFLGILSFFADFVGGSHFVLFLVLAVILVSIEDARREADNRRNRGK